MASQQGLFNLTEETGIEGIQRRERKSIYRAEHEHPTGSPLVRASTATQDKIPPGVRSNPDRKDSTGTSNQIG